jgi:hypothetical protein
MRELEKQMTILDQSSFAQQVNLNQQLGMAQAEERRKKQEMYRELLNSQVQYNKDI